MRRDGWDPELLPAQGKRSLTSSGLVGFGVRLKGSIRGPETGSIGVDGFGIIGLGLGVSGFGI